MTYWSCGEKEEMTVRVSQQVGWHTCSGGKVNVELKNRLVFFFELIFVAHPREEKEEQQHYVQSETTPVF